MVIDTIDFSQMKKHIYFPGIDVKYHHSSKTKLLKLAVYEPMTSPYHVKGITSLSELDMKTISEYPTKV